MHTVWIAAMTGLGEASATRIIVCSVGSAIALGPPNSRMSAPPENALPAPVMTIAFTSGSAFARSRPATTAERTAWPRPFTGGLSKVMRAMSPLVS